MNDKLQYATMLEIPVNTTNITFKPAKKRRKSKKQSENLDTVKEELMQKVNAETETAESDNTLEPAVINETEPNETAKEYVSASVHKKGKRPLFKFSAITVEVIAVFALIATIFLTNAFYENSAINVFMKKVFSPSSAQTVQEKTYADFSPVMNFNGEFSLEGGIISCTGSGAVYAATDGKVSSVIKEEDGTFTMNIAHSGLFSSKISGLSYAYLGEGDSVYGNIPVGYVSGGFTMCFNSDDGLITDYTIENSAVLWAV